MVYQYYTKNMISFPNKRDAPGRRIDCPFRSSVVVKGLLATLHPGLLIRVHRIHTRRRRLGRRACGGVRGEQLIRVGGGCRDAGLVTFSTEGQRAGLTSG